MTSCAIARNANPGVDGSSSLGASSGSSCGGSGSGAGSGSGGGSGAVSSSGGSSGSSSGEMSPPDASFGDPADGGAVTRDAISGSSCAADNTTQTTFMNLAPAMGAPLDRSLGDPIPGDAGVSAPQGWKFYQIADTVCRDGSPNGIYVRYTPSTKLLIYLEGGGACSSPHFCDHNPANLLQVFPGGSSNGESFGGSLLVVAGLQAPYTTGIFDDTNSANPFRDWNQIYIPYCTGDVHFGTNDNAQMADGINPSVMHTWHFVGYRNMQKFIGRIVPTFPSVDQVVLTGSSAGGFGAGLNFGMVKDAFGSVPVSVIDDSGPPFTDLQYLPACLQKQWRETFGFEGALPSDCAECKQPDGSGMTNILLYWHHKYPNAKVGLISTLHDQIIRLFFAAGMNNCASSDPNILSGLGLLGGNVPSYSGALYEQGLNSLRTQYVCTGALATYYIGTGDPDASTSNGSIDSLHEHLFRDRFYDPLAGPGQPTLAQWTADVVKGNLSQLGP